MGLIIIFNRAGIQSAFVVDGEADAQDEAWRLHDAFKGTPNKVELVWLD